MERLHGQPDSVRASRTVAAGEFRAPQVTSKQALEGPDGALIQVCALGHCAVRTPCCPWCCLCTMLNMHRIYVCHDGIALCWLHCVCLQGLVCTLRCTSPVLHVHCVIHPHIVHVLCWPCPVLPVLCLLLCVAVSAWCPGCMWRDSKPLWILVESWLGKTPRENHE